MKQKQHKRQVLDQQIDQQIGSIQQIQKLQLPMCYKTLILLPIIFGFAAYRIFFKHATVFCIIDMVHQWTYPINRWMEDGAWVTIIAIGQFITDGAVVFMNIFWIVFLKNLRLPATMALFYGVRAIFLNIEKFPFPEDIVWRSPGILNLSVPYDHTRDFFYSGHTGTIMAVFLQMYNTKMTALMIVSGFGAAYIMPFLLVTRIHYTIDVIGAVLFLVYINQFVKKYLFYFDYFFNLPYTITKWIYTHTCKEKCSQNSSTEI